MLATMTAIGVALTLIIATGSIWLIRSAVQEPFLERQRAETAFLAEQASHLTERETQNFAVRAAARLDARVTLMTADGTVVGDSAKTTQTLSDLDNHLHRAEVQAALTNESGDSLRVSDTTGVEYFYSAHRSDGSFVSFVRLALPSNHVFGSSSRYVGLVLIVIFGSLMLMSAVAYAAVRRLSAPIEMLTDAVEQVAEGVPESRLPAVRGVEASRLAEAVRRLREALEEKLGELETERTLLASVIAGMREGLLVVGPDRRVRLANAAARRIFDLPFDPVGRLLAEVVRDPTIHRDVELTLAEGREVRENVVRIAGNRAFELHVSPFQVAASDEVEALVLLFDITRLETLEGVRREFVSNVSHELRTPLTSIKAFVENLLDGGLDEPGTANRFLGIVLKHTNRMGALIDDLTDLSLIETGAVRLEIRSISAGAVVREVAEQLEQRAHSAGVSLIVDVPDDLVITADRRRLEQALVNLMENAVKFNRDGGTVRITGEASPRPVIRVSD
ncbi:PAS domain-containing protein, partial [bacterium]|nr:PAS domain-containing protein [bacterium]